MNDLEKEIELYLNQEMTPEQQSVFEQKIKNDPQLQKDIATYQEMHAVYNDTDWKTTNPATKNQKVTNYEAFLKSEKGKSIANSIKNAENQYFETKKPSNNKLIWLRYGAAIAAILVIAFLIVSQFNTDIDNKSLYAEYKNLKELPSLTLRDNNTELTKAEMFFKQEKYEKALGIFATYQSKNVEELNPQLMLYMGMAQLELDQHKEALSTFKKLLNSNTLDAPKATWYLALTYLKMDNLSKTKETLQTILTNPENYNYKNAVALLAELE